MRLSRSCIVLALLAVWPLIAAESCPPLRPRHAASAAPPPRDARCVVDPVRGDDTHPGSASQPWKTLAHALTRLEPGDTLWLRGGSYREPLICALRGREDAPITIRSWPGEVAVLDGGWAEFAETPQTAWEPVPGGAPDEFRSTHAFRNVRDVLGWFGDYMVGLNTYYHLSDLRATNEHVAMTDWSKAKEQDIEPLYCGPGLWYDPASGRIHVRLAHTRVDGVPNYTGETDPRRLPLVIAPFRSVPVTLDRAVRVTLRDLEIRGGGYDTVILDYAEHVTLENVTIWCGTYGLRASRTGPLTLERVRFLGSCPPWLARSDTSKRAYPNKPFRDLTRLNTHAPLVTDAGREFSVFATPVNDNWEIAHCQFTDAHDGPYLGGVSMRFHDNLVENTQDDGVYLSEMYPRHLYARGGATIHIYNNTFRRVLTALAFGGTEGTADTIYCYRNLFDLRGRVYGGRPSTKAGDPSPSLRPGGLIGDHGSPPWPTLFFYHNTVLLDNPGAYACAIYLSTAEERPRQVFNNLFLNLAALRFPILRTPAQPWLQADGNLFWSPGTDPAQAATALASHRQRSLRNAPETVTQPLEAHTLAIDPRLDLQAPDRPLPPGSPAIDAGVEIPPEWPDSRRDQDTGKPDIGAFPAGK